MPFELPAYQLPDFSTDLFRAAPLTRFEAAPKDGVAPEGFHATSVFPEYFHLFPARWVLLRDSRMDCVVVRRGEVELEVVEARRLREGEFVACGRRENGEEGIFVQDRPFEIPGGGGQEKFAFRTGHSRETSFSRDYDELYELLRFERESGFILWVLGPAVVFDRDSREALCRLIDAGFVQAVLAGNALATHDIEGDLFGTALGCELYTKKGAYGGHYHHLDSLNRLRSIGSIEAAVQQELLASGVMMSLCRRRIPYVLAGSIRDDGPMPGVISDSLKAQDAMRSLTRRATTVIGLATQLHSIATGNMTPCYRVLESGGIRPVYFYSVDMTEFAAGKLSDRGSVTARSILTNVQDFVVNLERALLGNR